MSLQISHKPYLRVFISMRKVTMITLTCLYCNKSFERILSVHKKQIKKYKSHVICCSNECRINYLNKITRRDLNTPFRRMFYRAYHTKNKRKECSITLDDVRNQWEKQKGICPYTGLKMILPTTSKRAIYCPRMASIDRIDSSKPYEKNNIQIVCVSMNYAKNSFSDLETKEFIREIIEVNQDAHLRKLEFPTEKLLEQKQ